MKGKCWSYWKVAMIAMMAFGSFSAHATTKWSLVGLGNSASPKPTNTYDEKMGVGGGLLFDINTGKKGSFEFGFLYAPKVASFTITSAGKNYTSTFTVPTLEIPLLLRLWMNRVMSIGIGGVYFLQNSLIGDATIETVSGAARLNSSVPVNGKGFGAEASLKFLIPFSHRFGLVLDGRYVYGISGAKWQEVEGIAGFCFGNNTRGGN